MSDNVARLNATRASARYAVVLFPLNDREQNGGMRVVMM
jgi:hypothetical protein